MLHRLEYRLNFWTALSGIKLFELELVCAYFWTFSLFYCRKCCSFIDILGTQFFYTTECLRCNKELYFLTFVWLSDFRVVRMYQHGSLVNKIPQIYLVDGEGLRPICFECKYCMCAVYFSLLSCRNECLQQYGYSWHVPESTVQTAIRKHGIVKYSVVANFFILVGCNVTRNSCKRWRANANFCV